MSGPAPKDANRRRVLFSHIDTVRETYRRDTISACQDYGRGVAGVPPYCAVFSVCAGSVAGLHVC